MSDVVTLTPAESLLETSSVCVEMLNAEDAASGSEGLSTQTGNDNYARFPATIDEILQNAANNGGKSFNVFLKSTDSRTLPRRDPRVTQNEIRNKIPSYSKINNVRYTRNGSWIFSTSDVQCAIDICHVTNFLDMRVTARVIFENITNRFLVFNIPVDIPLLDLAQEISVTNNIHILELRRFARKGQTNGSSPVLITILGTRLPSEIKLWFSIQNVKQFVDRPRQCTKCFCFNHPTLKCSAEQLCVTCGTVHEGPCTSPVKCVRCSGPHRADYNQCPSRQAEIEFLQFKSTNFLSFTEARRLYATKRNSEGKSFVKVASAQTTDLENIKKIFEDRTNTLLKIILESIDKQANTITEAISALSCLIMKFMEREHCRSPDRKKPNVSEKEKKPSRK